MPIRFFIAITACLQPSQIIRTGRYSIESTLFRTIKKKMAVVFFINYSIVS